MNKISLNAVRTMIVLVMASPLCSVHAGGPRGGQGRSVGQIGTGNFSGQNVQNMGSKSMTPRVLSGGTQMTPINVGNIGGKTLGGRTIGGTFTPISGGTKGPLNPLPGTINPFPGNNGGNGNQAGGGKGPHVPFPGTINPFPGTVNPFPGGKPPKGPIVVGPINPFPGTINPNPPGNPPSNPPSTPPTNPPSTPPTNPPGSGNGNGHGHGHCHPWYPCWRPWVGCYGTFRCPIVQPVYLPVAVTEVAVSNAHDIDLSIVSARILEPASMSQGALVRLQIVNKGPRSLDVPARVGLFGAEMNQTSGDMPSVTGEMMSLAVGATTTMDLRMPVEANRKPVMIVAIEMPEGYRDVNEQDNVAMGEMAKLPVATVSSR